MDGSLLDESISVLSQTFTTTTTYMSADGIDEKIGSSLSQYYFPVMDELTRAIPVNQYITPVITVIVLLQALVISFIPFGNDIWTQSGYSWEIIRCWAYIVDFGACNNEKPIVQIMVIIIYNLAWVILVSFILLYYKFEKAFIRSASYILRITMSYINYVMLIPTFTILGLSFNCCFQENNSIYIFITIVIAVQATILLYSFYIDSTFRSATLYIENTWYAQYLNTDVFLFFTIDALFSLNTRMLYLTPKWTLYVLIVFYCAYKCYEVFRFHFMPFKNNTLNSIFQTLAISQIFASIIGIISVIPQSVRLYLPICVLVIAIPLMHFVNYLLRKREKGEDLSSDLKARRAIRIYFAEHPDEFVNWELVKRITIIHQCPFILTMITRVLSFFPGESFQLFSYLSEGLRRTDLTLYQLFVFYQARKVYLLRQSINTKMVAYDVDKVRKDISVMTVSIQSLFTRLITDRSAFSIDLLIGLASMRNSIASNCRELLDKYPNNPIVTREYSKFLIECCSKFTKGLKYYSLALAIEKGKRVFGDQCFKMMIKSYPAYIKKGIINANGTKNALHNDGTLSYKSSRSSMTPYLGDSEQNEEVELNIEQADKFFSHSKLRMAYSTAVLKMKSSSLNNNLIVIWVKFVFIVGVFTALYIAAFTSTDTAEKRKEISAIIASFLDHLNVAFITFIEIWGNESQTIHHDIYIPKVEPEYMRMDRKYLKYNAFNAMRDYISLIKYFTEYDDHILERSDEQKYIFDQSSTRYRLLMNGSLVQTNSSAAITIFETMVDLIEVTAINFSKKSEWEHSSTVCEVSLNFKQIVDYFNTFSDNFISKQVVIMHKTSRVLFILTVTFVPLFFVILIVPIIISQKRVAQKFDDIFKILGLMSDSTLEETAKPICISDSELQGVSWRLESKGASKFLRTATSFIFALIFTLWSVLLIYIYYSFQFTIKYDNFWLSYSSRRHPSAINMLAAVYFNVFRITFPDIEWFKLENVYQINDTYDALTKLHNYLIKGSDEAPSCTGALPKLDELHFKESCSSNETSFNVHNMYECMSLDQLIVFYTQLAKEINKAFEMNNTNDFTNSDLFVHFRHMALYHTIPSLSLSVDYAIEIWSTNLQRFTNTNTALYVVVIVIAIVSLSINLYWHYQTMAAFVVFKSFLARICPLSAVENVPLLNLIESKPNANVIKSSLPKAIVALSPTPIVMYGQDGIVKFVNDSALKTLKMTREQIVGQNISSIFQSQDLVEPIDNNDNNVIQKTISIKGDNADETMQMNVKRFGGPCNVLIISDVTNLEIIKERLESIKIVNKGINQALSPVSLSQSLKSYHQEVSTARFIASVHIDIVHFTDYSASLAPINVLKSIETIMQCFEKNRSKYPLINRIPANGAHYRCVAGLFAEPEVSQSTIACQAVSFAIECMHGIDEINHAIESSLQLRIGISCGGPVSYCLISSKPPIFVVIGGPIKCSYALQSSALKGQLLVCEETSKLIAKDFSVVQDTVNFLDSQRVYQVNVDLDN